MPFSRFPSFFLGYAGLIPSSGVLMMHIKLHADGGADKEDNPLR
jgi:hypothetical protein